MCRIFRNSPRAQAAVRIPPPAIFRQLWPSNLYCQGNRGHAQFHVSLSGSTVRLAYPYASAPFDCILGKIRGGFRPLPQNAERTGPRRQHPLPMATEVPQSQRRRDGYPRLQKQLSFYQDDFSGRNPSGLSSDWRDGAARGSITFSRTRDLSRRIALSTPLTVSPVLGNAAISLAVSPCR